MNPPSDKFHLYEHKRNGRRTTSPYLMRPGHLRGGLEHRECVEKAYGVTRVLELLTVLSRDHFFRSQIPQRTAHQDSYRYEQAAGGYVHTD